jgi:hypothetical protein
MDDADEATRPDRDVTLIDGAATVRGTELGARLAAFVDQFRHWPDDSTPRLMLTMHPGMRGDQLADAVHDIVLTEGVVDVQWHADTPGERLRAVLAGYRVEVIDRLAEPFNVLDGDGDMELRPVVTLYDPVKHSRLIFAHAVEGGLSQRRVDLGELVEQALRHEEENYGGDVPGLSVELGMRCDYCNTIEVDVTSTASTFCPHCGKTRRLVNVATGPASAD